LVNPPKPSAVLPLYEARIAQYRAGDLTFCDCEQGQQAAAYYLKRTGIQSVEQRAKSERIAAIHRAAHIPPQYKALTIDSYIAACDRDPGKQAAIKALAALRSDAQIDGKFGLLLYGKPGVGKTGAVAPLLTHFIGQGCTGLWITYPEILDELRNFEGGGEREAMHRFKTVEYLFIDDIGDPKATASASDFARTQFFRILDERKSYGRPILATSNLDAIQMERQFDERIGQRLAEVCTIVEVKGKVLRK